MKKSIYITITLMFALTISKAQTAMQFSGLDCNGNAVDLFADLDAGKAVILHFYMPSCGSCPPPAQKIQTMANNLNKMYPGKVKGYAFPFQNSTTCSYSSTWVSSNNLSSLYAPMDSGALHVANYGGFGMPTVVLLGGKDHKVLFATLSFSTSDTSIMKSEILKLFGTSGMVDFPGLFASFNVFPNPVTDMVTFNLELNETSEVLIDIADITGKRVALVTNETQYGTVSKQFNTSNLTSGIYLVRVRANDYSMTRKINIAH